LVDADQAGWARGQLGEESVVQSHSDGSVVLAVTVTNREAFRSFVLGFLDHAEVLGPPALRNDIIAWLEALCAA
ncbi:MAG TPA: WYL domain-containing protein, partial [Acidimicrobiales bacterium]